LFLLEHGPLAEQAVEYGVSLERLPDNILSPVCGYQVADGLKQQDSVRLALLFDQKLAPRRHKLSRLMDPESCKFMLMLRNFKNFNRHTP